MKNRTIPSLITICLFLLPVLLPAQGTVAGSWFGELDIQGTKLTLTADISLDDEGKLSGLLHSPMQGAKDIPVTEIRQENDSVFITVASLMVQIRGLLLEGDTVLDCLFTQGPFTLPLILKRTDEPFSLNRPQEPQRPFPYVEQEVTIHNTLHEVALAGTLTLPDTAGRFPAVILVSGSGPQDRNEEIMGHKPFLVISDYLTRNGIAVLRYDDRGTAASSGNFATGTTEDFAEDAMAALRFLQSHPNINPEASGIIGHSEGGLIAQMIAARQDNPAAFIIMLAGPVVTGEEILLSQIKKMLETEGAPRKQIRRAVRDAEEAFDLIKKANNPQQAAAELEDFYAQRRAKTKIKHHNTYGYNEEAIQAYIPAYTSPWFIGFLKSDPASYLKKINIPMLALFGEKDVQVLPNINTRALDQLIRENQKKHFTYKTFTGRNHLFQMAETGSVTEYAIIEETFGEEVLEEMVRYIQQITTGQ
jgi:uncharacterized protein